MPVAEGGPVRVELGEGRAELLALLLAVGWRETEREGSSSEAWALAEGLLLLPALPLPSWLWLGVAE